MEGRAAPISAEILRVLRDGAAKPRAPGPEAHVADLLRSRVIERIGRACSSAGLVVMLVKGAALALTLYPPGTRPMGDVDILARRGDRSSVIKALEREGFLRHSQPDRPLTSGLLGEAQFTVECGSIPSVVELHTSLDKMVPRFRYERALWRRAVPAQKGSPPLAGLVVPSPEDHAVLIALHAASHEFHHQIAFLDLELLLRAGLDRNKLKLRSREARADSVMFVALSALRALGAASVDDDLIAAFDPGPARRRVIERFYNVGSFPIPRAAFRLGLPWILRQTPLRDDLAAWTAGVALYAGLRAVDRALVAADAIGLSNSGPRRPRARSSA